MVSTQSNTKYRLGTMQHAYLAVDGQLSDSDEYFAHTLFNTDSWLQLDFGKAILVSSVAIYTRRDKTNSMKSGTVYVGDTAAETGQWAENTVCQTWDLPSHSAGYVLELNSIVPTWGRYVILYKPDHTLQINEVVVNPGKNIST